MSAIRGVRAPREILAAAVPIAIAVFVFGISFGVLAIAAHLPAWAPVLMSMLVFAGSAQFAALGVITAGGSVLAAVLAGALLNLRYIATGIAAPGAFRACASQTKPAFECDWKFQGAPMMSPSKSSG